MTSLNNLSIFRRKKRPWSSAYRLQLLGLVLAVFLLVYIEDYVVVATSCVPGSSSVNNNCVACPIGTYGLDGTSCINCPTSMTTRASGSVGSESCYYATGCKSYTGWNWCSSCSPGYYLYSGSCYQCPVNSYNPQVSSFTFCLYCSGPRFSTAGRTGATKCMGAPSQPTQITQTTFSIDNATITWTLPDNGGSSYLYYEFARYDSLTGTYYGAITLYDPTATSLVLPSLSHSGYVQIVMRSVNAIGASSYVYFNVVFRKPCSALQVRRGQDCLCPAGYEYSATQDSGCSACPIGYYKDTVSSSVLCTQCSGTRNTTLQQASNSASQCVGHPSAPTALQQIISQTTEHSIFVQWSSSSDDGGSAVTGYRITLVDKSSNTLLATLDAPLTPTSMIIDSTVVAGGLKAQHSYIVFVNSVNVVGASSSTNLTVNTTSCTEGADLDNDGYSCVCVPGYRFSNASCTQCPVDTYKATASNQAACVPCSGLRFTTLGQTGKNECYGAPSQAQNLTQITSSSNSIAVSWLAPANNGGLPLQYVVTLTNATSGETAIGSDAIFRASNLTYSIGNLSPSSTYILNISTQNTAGSSRTVQLVVATQAMNCLSGSYNVDTGAISCDSCNAGSYFSGSSCVECEVGTYQPWAVPTTNSSSCLSCPTGYTTRFTGSVELRDCNACVIGYYQDGNGSCTACPAGGTTIGIDATACVCTPGHFPSGNDCLPCLMGFFGDGFSCSYCNGKKSMPGAQSFDDCFDPISCPPGYSDINGTYCEVCPAGSYSYGGTQWCQACPAGTTTSSLINVAVTDCNTCTPDFYRDEYGICKSCPGSFTSIGLNATECVCLNNGTDGGCPCPAGYEYVPTSKSVCDACPIGSYKDIISSNVSCAPCTNEGQTTMGVGSGSCDACIAGYHRNMSDSSCVMCEIGSWQPFWYTSYSSCYDCPFGYTTSSVGGTKDTDCDTCAIGFYRQSNGICQRCPIGFTTTGVNATLCVCEDSTQECLCPAGYENYTSSSESGCRACPIGTFKDTISSNMSCTPCSGPRHLTLLPATTSSSRCVGLPSPPRNLHIASTLESITVSWLAPIDDGGFDQLRYQGVLYREPNFAIYVWNTIHDHNITFNGLIESTSYVFTISAINAVGSSQTVSLVAETSGQYTPAPSEFEESLGSPVYSQSPEPSYTGCRITEEQDTCTVLDANSFCDISVEECTCRENFRYNEDHSNCSLCADYYFGDQCQFQCSLDPSCACDPGYQMVNGTNGARCAGRPSAPIVEQITSTEDSITLSWIYPVDDGGLDLWYEVVLTQVPSGDTIYDQKRIYTRELTVTYFNLTVMTTYSVNITALNSLGNSSTVSLVVTTQSAYSPEPSEFEDSGLSSPLVSSPGPSQSGWQETDGQGSYTSQSVSIPHQSISPVPSTRQSTPVPSEFEESLTSPVYSPSPSPVTHSRLGCQITAVFDSCTTADVNSFCDVSIVECTCKENFRFNEEHGNCSLCANYYYGADCQFQCHNTSSCGNNGVCSEGGCVCSAGYNLDNTTGNCTICATGYVRNSTDGDKCAPACSINRDVNGSTVDSCTNVDANSRCDTNSTQLCKCKTGYAYDGNSCKPVCNPMCSQASRLECVAPNTCNCTSDYTLVNGICKAICYGNSDCSVFPNTICDPNTAGAKTCVCRANWTLGDDGTCSICSSDYTNVATGCNTRSCSPACTGNSMCRIDSTGSPVCQCNDGYYGLNCEKFKCGNYSNADVNVCTKHGSCYQSNKCNCTIGYSGSNCEQYTCNGILSTNTASVCEGRGSCTGYNKCSCFASNNLGFYDPNTFCSTCRADYNGNQCKEKACDYEKTCNSHGTCDASKNCVCFNDEKNGHWSGSRCDSCQTGYIGTNCTIAKSLSLTMCNGNGEISAAADGVTTVCNCYDSNAYGHFVRSTNCNTGCIIGWTGNKCLTYVPDTLALSKDSMSLSALFATPSFNATITDAKSYPTLIVDCSQIMQRSSAALLGDAAKCSMSVPSLLSVTTLTIKLGQKPQLNRNSKLVFFTNALTTPNTNTKEVTIDVSGADKPIAALKSQFASNTLGSCDNAILSSYDSSGYGSNAIFAWSLDSNTAADVGKVSNITAVLGSLTQDAKKVVIPSGYIEAGKIYVFKLVITTAFGVASDAKTLQLTKTSANLPAVSISKKFSTMSYKDNQYLSADTTLCGASADLSLFDFVYTQTDGSIVPNSRITSLDNKIKIAGPFEVGTYSWKVVVSKKADASQRVEVTSSFAVQAGELTLSSNGASMTLSTSKNQNLEVVINDKTGLSQALSCSWACVVVSTGGDCSYSMDPVVTNTFAQAPYSTKLTIASRSLAADSYQFTAACSRGVKSASISIGIALVDTEPPSFDLSATGAQGKQLTALKIPAGGSLKLFAKPQSPFNDLQWNCPSAAPCSQLNALATTVNTAGMAPGQDYTFTLSAVHPTSKASGMSSIVISCIESITVGSISVNPPSGDQMKRYAISFDNWAVSAGSEGSLRYRFKRLTDTTNQLYSVERDWQSSNIFEQVTLPVGDPVYLLGEAQDSNGIISSLKFTVSVSQVVLSQADISNRVANIENATDPDPALLDMLLTADSNSNTDGTGAVEAIKSRALSFFSRQLASLDQSTPDSTTRDKLTKITSSAIVKFISQTVEEVTIGKLEPRVRVINNVLSYCGSKKCSAFILYRAQNSVIQAIYDMYNTTLLIDPSADNLNMLMMSSLNYILSAVTLDSLSDALTDAASFQQQTLDLISKLGDSVSQAMQAGEYKEIIMSSGGRVLNCKYSSMQASTGDKMATSDGKLQLALPDMNTILGINTASESLVDLRFELYQDVKLATQNSSNSAASQALKTSVKVGGIPSNSIAWQKPTGDEIKIGGRFVGALDAATSSSTFQFSIYGAFNTSALPAGFPASQQCAATETGCAAPQCVHWENAQWTSTGCSVVAVTSTSITCSCTRMTSIFAALQGSSSYVAPIDNPLPLPTDLIEPIGKNWATFYYACIMTGIGFIALALFALTDIAGLGIFTAIFIKRRMSSKTNKQQISDTANSRRVSNLQKMAGLLYDAVTHHLWISVHSTLILGLVGREPLLHKYQRLAVWWCAVSANAVGAVALVGGIRPYWPLETISHDDILARYWLPAVVCACVCGKGVQIILTFLFDRLGGGFVFSFEARPGQKHSIPARILLALTTRGIIPAPFNLPFNLILCILCGVFIFFMTFCIIYVGLEFYEVQSKLWLIGALVGILLDLVALDPIYLLIRAVIHMTVGDLVRSDEERQAKSTKTSANYAAGSSVHGNVFGLREEPQQEHIEGTDTETAEPLNSHIDELSDLMTDSVRIKDISISVQQQDQP